ncbi:hypothetical protein L7F22_033934 [Adiantum nelumboides]|nr:hypothetical protein [Adiantum nelumboides]
MADKTSQKFGSIVHSSTIEGIDVRPGTVDVAEVVDVAGPSTRTAAARSVLPTAEQARWDVKNAQAHALIALSVKHTITPHIRSAKSAKQAWDILAGLYAGRNEAKIALLRKELESKIMNEEDDMDTFLASIKDINEQLISAGEIVSDKSLVQTVLDALPDSYQTFASTWQLMNQRNLDVVRFDEVCTLLLQEALSKKTGNAIPIASTQAFDKVLKFSISCYMVFVKESKEYAYVLKASCSETKEESKLSNLLNEFQDVFMDYIPNKVSPPTKGQDDHTIKLLPDSSPPNKPPYRVSQEAQQEEIMRQVNELVEKGMVRSSSYPFCSPILSVQKKDVANRLCGLSCSQLDNHKNRYPAPKLQDLFEKL